MTCLTGQTVLVPGAAAPTGAFGARAPSISDDGRLVAFTGAGQASNAGTPAAADEVFVADLADGSLVQVSRTVGGSLPDRAGHDAVPAGRRLGGRLRLRRSRHPRPTHRSCRGTSTPCASAAPRARSAGGPGARSKFVPLTPFRVLDTRNGIGVPIGKPARRGDGHGEGGGVGTVPADVSAVALNVTATQASAGGFVTVFPGGSPRPPSSNLNLDPASARPSRTSWWSPCRANGTVSLYTYVGTHLLADVLGYFVNANNSTDGRYVALSPARILDTRNGIGAPTGKVPAGATVNVAVAGQAGVPATGVQRGGAQRHGHRRRRPGLRHGVPARRAAAERLEPQPRPRRPDDPEPRHGARSGPTARSTCSATAPPTSSPTSRATSPTPRRPRRRAGCTCRSRRCGWQDTRSPFARPASEGAVTRLRVNLPPLPATGVAAAMLNVTATQAAGAGLRHHLPGGRRRCRTRRTSTSSPPGRPSRTRCSPRWPTVRSTPTRTPAPISSSTPSATSGPRDCAGLEGTEGRRVRLLAVSRQRGRARPAPSRRRPSPARSSSRCAGG